MSRNKRGPLISSLPLAERSGTSTLQDWLYNSLRDAILSGRLPADSTLPSTRSLAFEHGIARGTVQAAYHQLTAEGFVVSFRGSGTKVTALLPDIAVKPTQIVRRPNLKNAFSQPPATGEWITHLRKVEPAFPIGNFYGSPVPFVPHRCDVSQFPIDIWRRLHLRHLRSSRLPLLWDSTAGGLPVLKDAIAQHLAISRGVAVSPENIVIVESVQRALDISVRLLTRPSDAIWMEDPGYPGARQIFQASGAKVIDVAVDKDGMRVQEAMKHANNARLCYVTPSRQAPLCVTLSPERRIALIKWAVDNNSYIFEDDYDSEFRFISKPIPALKSMADGDSRIILAGTFSKLLFPALRIAYVVLPPMLVEDFTRAVSLTSRSVSALAQSVLADFMIEGNFDRHIRRMRKLYASRAEAFQEAAFKYWKDLIEVPPVHAGLDVVARLVGIDEVHASRKLLASGLDAFPLARYTSTTRLENALVMGFAPFDEKLINSAAQKMATALQGK